MKSVKPGRGPSAIRVWGAVVAVVFGIIWTAMAVSMGAPSIFPVFGVLFIITGIIVGIYNLKNTVGKNRYSTFDITDENEEPDPLNQRFGSNGGTGNSQTTDDAGFCPYCGAPAERDYEFCRRCGKRIS